MGIEDVERGDGELSETEDEIEARQGQLMRVSRNQASQRDEGREQSDNTKAMYNPMCPGCFVHTATGKSGCHESLCTHLLKAVSRK
jgi:hypothetical protein